MASEIELKLTTDPESLARVREHPSVAAVIQGQPRSNKTVSTYYDTRGQDLRKAGVALRMRRSGQRWIQTVKGAGDRIGALHRRPEYEWPARNSRIDPRKLATTPWHDVFDETAGRLRPVFMTDFDRTEHELAFPDGTRAVLCLDSGEVRSGRRRAQLIEIELELIEGEPGPLYALALSLASDLPVTVSQTSKSERGYALASHAPRKPLRAGKITLAPDISVGAALARVGSDCLTQIGANAQSVGASDGEFVHQARVGTRRLRSLLNIVADLKGPDTVLPLLQELRWLSASLGAARDWDVLASETLASVTQALRHAQARRDVGTLRGRVTRQRNIHFAEAAAAAVSPRAQRLLLAFGALFAELESSAAEPALCAPARTLAKDILERRARRLGKRAAHLRRVSPDERHQARIAAKKLRYVAEMFAPLFAGNRTREYLSALGKLQSELGRLNDLATGERLLDEVEKLTHAQRLVHGAGIARGWLAGAEASAVTDAARAWRKLAKQKPFWR